MIKRKKTAYLGHIMHNIKYELLRRIIQRKIKERKEVGCKKLSWLRNIRQWTEPRSGRTGTYSKERKEDAKCEQTSING